MPYLETVRLNMHRTDSSIWYVDHMLVKAGYSIFLKLTSTSLSTLVEHSGNLRGHV